MTLRGRVRGLVLATGLDDPDPATEALYARWHQERLADPEWMLDLTEATGDLTIRGYPARFVRRNPELQAVVTAEAVADSAWRSVDPGRSALRVALHELVRSGWEDVILVADPHGAHADDDLQVHPGPSGPRRRVAGLTLVVRRRRHAGPRCARGRPGPRRSGLG